MERKQAAQTVEQLKAKGWKPIHYPAHKNPSKRSLGGIKRCRGCQ